MKLLSTCLAFTALLATQAKADTISFEFATSMDYASGPYTEGNFSVDVATSSGVSSANFKIDDTGVASGGSLPTAQATYQGTTGNGILSIVRTIGGTLFNFDQVDLGAFGGSPLDVTARGFLGAVEIASDTFSPAPAPGSGTGSFGSFNAVNLAGQTIDSLQLDFGNVVDFDQVVAADNIDLTLVASAAVPEPSSFACLLLGGIGLYARRRRRS